MIRTRMKVLAAVAALSIPVVGVSAAAAETVRWHDCVPVEGFAMDRLRCATLSVPLDYARPDGQSISVEVSKRAADDPARRRGVLLLNPGGPGSPVLPMPLQFEDMPAARDLLARYDLIAFDPRGIGLSTPVTCDLSEEQRGATIGPYARNAADVDRQAVRAAAVARQCGQSATAHLLPHMNTANTARDMDRIRAALGEKTISYFGTSYGSYLGAVYASRFPDRTDRVVLDSVLGPGGMDVTTFHRFAVGFEARFPDFASWAADRHETFQLGRTPAEVRSTFTTLADNLDRQPVNGMDGAAFRAATYQGLYSDGAFPRVAEVWRSLREGARAAGYPDLENHAAGQIHVICNDSDWPESVSYYRNAVARARITHPMFGPAAANINPCAAWPADRTEPKPVIGDKGPSNILLVQNLRDPATPVEGARGMRAALGSRAGLVTVDQGGHGVLGVSPNRCGTDAVLGFLTGTAAPADGFCPAESRG